MRYAELPERPSEKPQAGLAQYSTLRTLERTKSSVSTSSSSKRLLVPGQAIVGIDDFASSTLTFDVAVDETIEIDTDVVINRTVEVPINTEIPINQECDPTLSMADGQLRIKATPGPFADRLAAQGCSQWRYRRRNGKETAMPYWSLPDTTLDDPGAACALARDALDALTS